MKSGYAVKLHLNWSEVGAEAVEVSDGEAVFCRQKEGSRRWWLPVLFEDTPEGEQAAEQTALVLNNWFTGRSQAIDISENDE